MQNARREELGVKRVHHDLKAWQEAMSLVKMIYESTNSFPAEENFGLKSQIRRAAVSIPSNIAEGAARTGSKEFLQFLSNMINVETKTGHPEPVEGPDTSWLYCDRCQN
jgi:hypothetical protein